MFNLRCFKAGKGDCFLLTWETDETHRLLIDSGIEGTYRFFGPLVKDFNEKDSIVITHVDYDHIGGVFKWLNDDQQPLNPLVRFYMNTPQLLITPEQSDKVGIEHGINLEQLLKEKGITPHPLFLQQYEDNILYLNGLQLKILSPAKEVLKKLIEEWTAKEIYQNYLDKKLEDNDKVSARGISNNRSKDDILNNAPKPHRWDKDLLNSSSIAFVLSFNEANILFMGDSNPDLIVDELSEQGYTPDNKLPLEILKISHHGAKYNTTKRLLEIIDCSKYLLSTDSSGPYYHPSRETLILISEYGRSSRDKPIVIYSNYSLDIDKLLSQDERFNIEFKEIEHLEIVKKKDDGTFE
ncbi:MBL fold metallo-hydrolase [Chryseobacterium aquaticum]|uniref:MBL fold metallo-hydrolase n=1 Tax=Chryseobacterium aquaticum TaxID=452084 RepID=A0A848NCW8_9FLAO|nr:MULTISPECIES: MBL fold metallo-hydrolase [Chryseobacterium]NMR35333.1 MBL fold metallo-hydrolase [Chryseobacterium aquaticum]NRQ47229.1 MBL fold metallo-hydrolase [Chryseobacterium sp. C-204]